MSYKKRVILTLVVLICINFIPSFISLPGAGGFLTDPDLVKDPLELARIHMQHSVNILGILPFLTAYFTLTFLSYLFSPGAGKGLSNWDRNPRGILLILLLATLLISLLQGWGIGWAWTKILSHGIAYRFFITFVLAAFVMFGVFAVCIVDRLGVIDGVFAVLLVTPRTILSMIQRVRNFWIGFIGSVPEANDRLGRIILTAVILVGIVLILKRLWKRDFFSRRIPLKSGREISIPIYMGGIFFFLLGYFALHLLLAAVQVLVPLRLSPPWMKLWYVFQGVAASIFGYWLYIKMARLVLDFETLRDRIELSPEEIFNTTYRRFGLLCMGVHILLSLFMAPGYAGPALASIGDLFRFLLTYILLFIIFFLEGGKERKIITGDFVPVFRTNGAREFLEARISLLEAGIDTLPHQHIYNYTAGYTVGPVSEKILYVKGEDAEKAKSHLAK